MRTKLYFITVAATFFLFFSCNLLEDELTGSVAERLEGRWQCDETATEFKAALDFYEVNIYIHPIDDDQILIENFYDLSTLSSPIDVVATVDGMNIIIHEQDTDDGFTIYGNGVVASNYNKINWTYFANDGSGIWDEVTAIYTRIE